MTFREEVCGGPRLIPLTRSLSFLQMFQLLPGAKKWKGLFLFLIPTLEAMFLIVGFEQPMSASHDRAAVGRVFLKCKFLVPFYLLNQLF